MQTGHPIIAASIGGTPATMVLDTGASHTVLDSTRLERFGLTPASSGLQAIGLGGTPGAVGTVPVPTMWLGTEVELRELQASVVSLGPINSVLSALGQDQIDGVVGGDILRSAEAIIDYRSSILYLR